jgi:tetratricopeptide (TPR) repeat protein
LKAKAAEMHEKARSSQLESLKKQAQADPNNAELQAQIAALTNELAQEIVTDCRARVEGNPTDPQLRFELGQALFNAENFSEAIPELQRARNNPYYRIKAMLMLGKCYEAKGMNDMALRQLSEANNELTDMDATKLEILYLMGIINEKLDRKTEALDCFKAIYDSNYGYRDVAQRVESSYA